MITFPKYVTPTIKNKKVIVLKKLKEEFVLDKVFEILDFQENETAFYINTDVKGVVFLLDDDQSIESFIKWYNKEIKPKRERKKK